MHTPTTAAGTIPADRGLSCRRWFTRPRMLHAAPVAVTALYGSLRIALHAGGGRGSAHALWQSLALAETLLAPLLRQRKPIGALAGILAAYLLFALDPLLLPGALFALLTVAASGHRRTMALAATVTAAAITVMPYLHGDPVSLSRYALPRLAAAAIAATANICLGARRQAAAVRAHPGHRPAGVSLAWRGPDQALQVAPNEPVFALMTVESLGILLPGETRADPRRLRRAHPPPVP